uniref:Hemoglobin beta embryonic-2 n=1 Tax=Sinocyclocheilus grahami TaxID=75366 RepID=A0A672K8F4_SINGR
NVLPLALKRHLTSRVMQRENHYIFSPKALQRALVVYRWTQRYFASWKALYNAEAIMSNPKVANTYAELSVLHSEKLHEDPDNFRVFLADCLTIVIAATMGTSFTADVQAAWQKFLAVVVSALRRQYH